MNLNESVVKYTAFYRCVDDIKNLRIRVRFKNVESVDFHETVLKWQQKVFSNFERELYKDAENCAGKEASKITDDVIFTYTENDTYDTRSENCTGDGCEKMHVMADLGTYVDGVWVKNEHLLCTIKYDTNRGLFSIYPDYTQKDPYFFQTHDDITRNFVYYLDDISEKLPEEVADKEEALFHKVSLHNKAPQKPFETTPKDILRSHLLFEILWAKDFDNCGYIYVRYFVHLPDSWSCQNRQLLSGATQNCRSKNNDGVVHFGYAFDLALDRDLKKIESGFATSACVYFEVVSKDTWQRFRSEGLAYCSLPLTRPGAYEYDLQCCRLRPKGFRGDLRRFFVGDCYNYDDTTWVGPPKEHEAAILCKFGVNTLGTGKVGIRAYVVHQSEAFINNDRAANDAFVEREKFLYEKLNSNALYKSVHEVLEAFKKARQNMNEAKKQV